MIFLRPNNYIHNSVEQLRTIWYLLAGLRSMNILYRTWYWHLNESGAYLRIGQFATLQTGHVAPQAELLTVEPFQILLPLHYLIVDLLLGVYVGNHRLLKIRHVLHLVVLRAADTISITLFYFSFVKKIFFSIKSYIKFRDKNSVKNTRSSLKACSHSVKLDGLITDDYKSFSRPTIFFMHKLFFHLHLSRLSASWVWQNYIN